MVQANPHEEVEPMQARDFFDEPPAQPARAPSPEPRAATPPPVPTPAPVAQPAPTVVFHAVSEHDAAGDELHKPVRRRRQGQPGETSQEVALQMVETQADALVAPAVQEDEPPRRSRPRKRRSSQGANEPLMLVETQPGAEGSRPDSNQP